MDLNDLQEGESGIIVRVRGSGAFRRRITEMGFVKGKIIKVIKSAPLKDPVEYQILGYQVSLRRSEACLIDVIPSINEIVSTLNFSGVQAFKIEKSQQPKTEKEITVALVGNPNSGKTSLFNWASNSKEHVGNYSGVTVESKEAQFKHNGYIIKITDLPGTYSLSEYSPEEVYVRRHLFTKSPDVTINVIDASNLERNLFLTTELIDMGNRMVIALNMFDELQQHGDKFDYNFLGKMINIPFVPTVGRSGKGINELFDKVIEIFNNEIQQEEQIHVNYGKEVEESIAKVQREIVPDQPFDANSRFRFYAIKLLEKDQRAAEFLQQLPNFNLIKQRADKEIVKLEEFYHESSDTLIADARYGFIAGALKETFKPTTGINKLISITDKIDNILTNKWLGFPLFITFLWIIFQSTFTLGEYPMIWIESLVSHMGELADNVIPDGFVKELIINGIIGGVGGVIIFLPNILILFFFISIMEDSGYMARIAFIMDKLMHKIGLHGKSFIPLIMGFGCNVPAIMATRTLRNANDRILTMLINPFMSCSARLPVYLLIAGTFFPTFAGTVVFSLYLTGILLAVLIAILFKKLIFKTLEAPFVMELPPYRMPSFISTVKHMWLKAYQYLQKMGGIILIASVILWLLGKYPINDQIQQKYNTQISQLEQDYAFKISKLGNQENQSRDSLNNSLQNEISLLKNLMHHELHINSYIGKTGKFIEPVIKPLGFDWRMGVSLLSGAAAKEVVVSTLGVMFFVDENTEQNVILSQRLKSATIENNKPLFTPLTAYTFMLFVLIYMPCIAVTAAIRRESSSWQWPLFMIGYSTALAWIVCFIVYQIGILI